jgi:hypothetical protein
MYEAPSNGGKKPVQKFLVSKTKRTVSLSGFADFGSRSLLDFTLG